MIVLLNRDFIHTLPQKGAWTGRMVSIPAQLTDVMQGRNGRFDTRGISIYLVVFRSVLFLDLLDARTYFLLPRVGRSSFRGDERGRRGIDNGLGLGAATRPNGRANMITINIRDIACLCRCLGRGPLACSGCGSKTGGREDGDRLSGPSAFGCACVCILGMVLRTRGVFTIDRYWLVPLASQVPALPCRW